MPDTKKPEAEATDTFDQIVKAIDSMEVEPDRHLSIQIDQACRDAIRAAQTSGQTAGVTISLKVKRDAERRVSFSANVTPKLPRPALSGVTLYADADGNVHRSDPAQLRMFEGPKPVPLHHTPTSKKEA